MTVFFNFRKPALFALSVFMLAPLSLAADETNFTAVTLQWRSDGEAARTARTLWPSEALSAVKTDLDGDGTAEVLVRFDGRCVAPAEPGDEPGCPYTFLRWTNGAWKVLTERSAWTVSAYASQTAESGSSVAALEIDGELFVVRNGSLQSLDARISPLVRTATSDEVRQAERAYGARFTAGVGIEAETGLIDIDADEIAEKIILIRLPPEGESVETERPWPWVILDARGKALARGEAFAMPDIIATPDGGRIAASSTPSGLKLMKLY